MGGYADTTHASGTTSYSRNSSADGYCFDYCTTPSLYYCTTGGMSDACSKTFAKLIFAFCRPLRSDRYLVSRFHYVIHISLPLDRFGAA